jgi:hypothetical protein
VEQTFDGGFQFFTVVVGTCVSKANEYLSSFYDSIFNFTLNCLNDLNQMRKYK